MNLKPITHSSAKTTFKVNPRNGIIGSLNRMFKPQYMNQQIGELFEIIAGEIFEDRTAFASKAQFSLINMTNLLQFSSVGYSERPPEKMMGKSPALVFTFALSATPAVKYPDVKKLNQNYDGSELITYWMDAKNNRYLTISVAKTTLRDLKISFNTVVEMTYVYNCIGLMTKSFINQNNWYTGIGRNYTLVNDGMDASSIWSKYFQKPVRSMINDHPMNSWIYCLDFWVRCPNLLSSNFLNIDEFGLYYILYLHDRVPANSSSIYRSLHSQIGGIKDYIAEGIQDFNRALNNPASSISDNCYAFVHLLEATVEPGGIGTVVDRDYARSRINYMSELFTSYPDLSTAFYGFMSDSNIAYRSLIDGNTSFNKVMERIL